MPAEKFNDFKTTFFFSLEVLGFLNSYSEKLGVISHCS